MSRALGTSASEEGAAPGRQLGVTLAEKRPHKASLKSLHQRRIGDVALELIELA